MQENNANGNLNTIKVQTKILNQKKTANNVRHFLLNEYPKYQNLSIYATDLKGLNYDEIKVSKSINPSSNANIYIKTMHAETIVKCVRNAIANCEEQPRKPYKTILTKRFLDGLMIREITYKIGYSESRFDVLQRKALLNFADLFLLEQLKQKIAFDDLIDLHIYKDNRLLRDA